ncbi:peptide/nickel transport system permease protein [Actinomycetospora succinea]|uniref:Peptide/nickel transport system permease protein n=1 Tax=Actinomycetospora succinea TaxID=663603 RepID=A0A4R6VL40_9PSEU|nr:ABC transporter permease subunit [Actinomycetospora succinea]TDQ62571.1 peptide/nickel transport system permease protein [Actinomycetospora succinea]
MSTARRFLPLVTGALAVLVLTVVVAALPWLWDEDPAASVLRVRYPERGIDPDALDALRAELDLPADPVTGALGWLGGALTGDLGTSWVSRAPVGPSVAGALGVSLTLALSAVVVAAVAALALLAPGVWRAARRGASDTGRGGAVVASVLGAVPEIVLGAVLVAVVAVGWGLLPSTGFAGPAHLVLPALALGLPAGGLLARMLSSAAESALAEGWVRTWRSWGTPPGTVALGVARRAVATASPQIALLVVGLLGSAVAVEQLFGIPGVGSAALDAVLAQDLPVAQAAVMLLVVLGLVLGAVGVLAHRALLGPARSGSELPAGVPLPSGHARSWAPWAAASALALVVLTGLPRDGATTERRLAPPSWSAPMGTDAVGRDLWARIAHGALLTVGTAVAVTAVCLVIGLLVGVGGRSARAGAADVVNALPPVVVGLVIAAVAGPGLLGAAIAVIAVGWVPLAVHARTLATEARASGYVRAAVLAGATPWRIARRHVLPAVVGPVTRHGLARVPHAALGIAALSFLGLGAAPDSPEWGAVLADSLAYVERAPWTILAPTVGLALLAVVVALVRESRASS